LAAGHWQVDFYFHSNQVVYKVSSFLLACRRPVEIKDSQRILDFYRSFYFSG